MRSENPSGAVNQQERPGVEQWVVGFVDGEGCFSISVVRNAGCRLGWQVQHEFSVTQAAGSRPALELLVEVFGCGTIIEKHSPRRSPGTAHALLREAPSRSRRCRGAVLRRTPTENRQAVRLPTVRSGPADDAGTSAPRGGRTPEDRCDHAVDEPEAAVSILGILRGHTPTISVRHRDEDMVRASWRHGEYSSEIPCRVSSDLHEWRNDLATVSTRDPAKLHDE